MTWNGLAVSMSRTAPGKHTDEHRRSRPNMDDAGGFGRLPNRVVPKKMPSQVPREN